MPEPVVGESTQQFDIAPVYLLSTERSGSNLVRSILGAHSEITAPHPLETAYPWRQTTRPTELSPQARGRLVRDVLINKNYSFHPLVETVDVGNVQNRVEQAHDASFFTIQEALYAEYADTVGANAWVSKDPGQWDYVERATKYYRDLKVVYLVRDARDVVLSFKNSNVGKYHPYFNARRWQSEQARGRELLEQWGDRIHLVQYEDLLQQPERVVRELCRFLDLPFEVEMLYYYDTEDAQKTSDSAGVFENLSIPIKSDNFGKFRDQLPDEETAITEKVAGRELESFDYNLVNDEERLESFQFDVDRYREEDASIARTSRRDYWRNRPREQLGRLATKSFSMYMILRYGLLG